MMLSAFALVIGTEKLEVHSPTELLFMVKKLSVKMGDDTDTIFPLQSKMGSNKKFINCKTCNYVF